MVVALPELFTVEVIEIEPKLSDQVAALPASLFCGGDTHFHGQMCGLGIIWALEGRTLATGLNPGQRKGYWTDDRWTIQFCNVFPTSSFDRIFRLQGPEAAKQFTIDWLRERGL